MSIPNRVTLDDVNKKISKCKTLAADVKEILKTFLDLNAYITHERDQKIVELEEKYEVARNEQEEKINELTTKVEMLTEKLATFENSENKIQELRDYVDENDAYERRDSLIFSGRIMKAGVNPIPAGCWCQPIPAGGGPYGPPYFSRN